MNVLVVYRTHDHARAWVAAGHRVTVVTGVPNFPRGEVFDGYVNRPYQRETIDGVDVVRVWTYIAPNRGFGLRILDYLSFLAAGTLAGLALPKPDVVLATSPQFFTAVAGFLIGVLRGRPWVFEVRDLWPESIRAVGAMRESRVLDALESLAGMLYRHADLVVPVTEPFRRHLLGRGVPEARIRVVTNGIDASTVRIGRPRDEERDRLGLPQDACIAAYVGTVGMAHGVGTLVQAAQLARDDPSLHFVVMGEGAEKDAIRERIRDAALDNVSVLDGRPRQEAFDLMAACDVSLVMLRNSPLFETVIPSKIFESMALRRPILIGVRGESRRIVVDECAAGLAFPPEDAEALVAGLRRLRDDPDLRDALGRRGREAVERSYSRSSRARDLLRALGEVVARNRI
jgi:glycosyltransferase involved in cell wall biosynthesis